METQQGAKARPWDRNGICVVVRSTALTGFFKFSMSYFISLSLSFPISDMQIYITSLVILSPDEHGLKEKREAENELAVWQFPQA